MCGHWGQIQFYLPFLNTDFNLKTLSGSCERTLSDLTVRVLTPVLDVLTEPLCSAGLLHTADAAEPGWAACRCLLCGVGASSWDAVSSRRARTKTNCAHKEESSYTAVVNELANRGQMRVGRKWIWRHFFCWTRSALIRCCWSALCAAAFSFWVER